MEVFLAEPACGVFTNGLEHADDVQVLVLVAARQNGAAVNINGRDIGPEHAHHAAGHVLVTASDHQDAIHPLPLDAGFNAIGNDFTRDQRVFHALGAHGHAVRNGGRTEYLGVSAVGTDSLNGSVGQLLEAGVAGRDGAVAIG